MAPSPSQACELDQPGTPTVLEYWVRSPAPQTSEGKENQNARSPSRIL
jgi:hypothetical protein